MIKAEITINDRGDKIPYSYDEERIYTPEKYELRFNSSNLLWLWFKEFKPRGFIPYSTNGTTEYEFNHRRITYKIKLFGLNPQYLHQHYYLNDDYLGDDEQGLAKLHTMIAAKIQTTDYEIEVDGDFEKYKVGNYEVIDDAGIYDFVEYDGLDITIKTEYHNPEEMTYEEWYKLHDTDLPFSNTTIK